MRTTLLQIKVTLASAVLLFSASSSISNGDASRGSEASGASSPSSPAVMATPAAEHAVRAPVTPAGVESAPLESAQAVAAPVTPAGAEIAHVEPAQAVTAPINATQAATDASSWLPDGPNNAKGVSPGGFSSLVPTVLLRFPLRTSDWWTTTNYLDLQAGAGLLDYGCHGVTYDGHTGNDIIIRDFVEMDEGRYALAAAPGTVIDAADGNFDRNTASNGNPANYIVIQHSDGSLAYYYHLAKWSTLVYTGQSVLEGQPVGLVGSSGNSTDPHLHLEIQQSSVVYEPGAGACRAGASNWKSQLGHAVDNPATLYDIGETPAAPDTTSIKFRPPNVTHFQQTGGTVTHYVWIKLADVHAGDTSRVVWRAPNNSVYFDTGSFSHTSFFSYSWWYWAVNLPTSGSTGTWTVQYFLGGVQQAQLSFTYNTTPSQAPVATSRTVAVPKAIARDGLRGSDADGDLKQFRLVANPAHGEVTLSGPRGRTFAYLPESGYSGTDTWQFQVDDGQGSASASGTMTMNVSPVIENALRLEDQGDDDISVSAGSAFNVNSFTLEAWIRRTAGSSGWQGIIDRRHPTLFNLYGYSLFIQPNSRLRATVGRGFSSSTAVGGTPIPMDRWVHVAATYAAGALLVFVNGVLDGSAAFAGSVNYAGVGDLLIGGSFSLGESFRGEIEEARFWNIARSAAQLKQGGTCSFFDSPLPSSVIGWWRFQGNASDSSGNGNAGTRFAGASFVRTDSGLPLNCSVQNSDGEGGADRFDNCPLDPNPTQQNTDGDGFGDLCDLCPQAPTAIQIDSDRDGVGDPCDTCPFAGNTEQLDTDGDGAGDLCDPAPASAAQAVPSDQITLSVTHDRVSGISTLAWTAGAFAASYEVTRGVYSELQSRFYGTCQNSRDGNTADTVFLENQAPAPGSAFHFLIVGVASDGTRGLAGLDSDGRQRDLRAKDCL